MSALQILCDLLMRLPPERRESALCELLFGKGCRCNLTHAGACP